MNASRPNVVVLLADDAGWGDLGFNGHPTLRTPALDSLARDGAHFERFYVQPVCAPTRAEFLTGRHAPRVGVVGVSEGEERLALREETIADVFRGAGYATGCFGKWHNGTQYPYHPNGRGFDEFYGFTSGHWGSYFDAVMDHNGEVVTGRGYMADDITDHTIDFMRAQSAAGKPFLAYLAFNTPHSPMQVPDGYWDAWDGRDIPSKHRFAEHENRAHTKAALAMMENLDANAARILAEIDRLGITANTIVLYFTDNGPNGWRWNGDLKGKKATTDEGGVRSPLLIRWPGHIGAGVVVKEIASAVDLLPTLAGLAGIEHAPELPLDGASCTGALTGTGPAPADHPVFASWLGKVSVRTQRFMLDEAGELFDLVADARQTVAVTRMFPDEAKHLQQVIADWRGGIARDGAKPVPAIPVGHPEVKITELPARDAVLHGGLERSNPYPNDSFVTNWRSTDDFLTWDVDVTAAGRFAVEIYYTAPQAGASLEIRLGDAVARGVVDKAWDPPLRGMENDRIPRDESYVKTFKPLALGEVTLPAGSDTLRLSACGIRGASAIDFKLLVLRRLDD